MPAVFASLYHLNFSRGSINLERRRVTIDLEDVRDTVNKRKTDNLNQNINKNIDEDEKDSKKTHREGHSGKY